MRVFLATIVFFFSVSFAANAQTPTIENSNIMDELNPFDPDIESQLLKMDEIYEQETGEMAIQESLMFAATGRACKKADCPVWIRINKKEQKAYLYRNGALSSEWLVSTGISGRSTPNFEGTPNGRIYTKYSSSKYPGGNYKGLGNMPYAVFYKGGFAIHGTTEGNFKRLGTRASHGCVRLHPDNGQIFNSLVRQYGIYSVWISIHE